MEPIIKRPRSIIPACDVSIDIYKKIVKETSSIDGVGAYKIGFQLALTHGLPKIVEITRKYTDKPIIYDHQKAATDIPDTGIKFMGTLKNAGVDAVILFPQSGPETQKAWIDAALKKKLGVIVGGLMTHPMYVRSEGGYINDESIKEIYLNAANQGVVDFVVPGNKPEFIKEIRELLESKGIKPIFYSPGFIAQGGSISEATKVVGSKWHAIIGRGIYEAEDIKKATLEYTSQI